MAYLKDKDASGIFFDPQAKQNVRTTKTTANLIENEATHTKQSKKIKYFEHACKDNKKDYAELASTIA